MVRDTTYFFAASIVRAKGSIQSGLADVYDRLVGEHRYAELTDLLVSRVLVCNSSGKPYVFSS
jgi:hypothetical protein